MPVGYPPGWIGGVQANTGTEVRRGSVEVFHGFCDRQEIECANESAQRCPQKLDILLLAE